MKNFLQTLPRCLLLVAIVCSARLLAYSQEYASSNSFQDAKPGHQVQPSIPVSDMRSLRQILYVLGRSYGVSFNYDDDAIKDISLEQDFTWNKKEKLNKVLERLLPSLQLRFERLNQKDYLIYPLNRMRHLNGGKRKSDETSANQKIQNFPLDPAAQIPENPEFPDQLVSGRITDENSQPLPGVNIIVKGTTTGTTSDALGEFKISVPDEEAVLVFSFIGYKSQEVKIGNQAVINVTMVSDIKTLDEVVVTAFGIEKEKKAVGFAVQELNQKDLTDAREVSIANYLTGKIAGVQVSRTASGTGGSTKVIIRGISSLTGENQPLYVVDGVPLDNTRYKEANFAGNGSYGGGHDFGDGIGNLNPQDIESMTVLKGPNATALYGSRGSNGVILITTKSGKAGKGIGVEINSGTTIEKLNLFPNVQNKYGPGYEDINVYGDIVSIDGVNYETIPSWHSGSYGPPMNGQLFVNPFVFDPNDPPTTFALLPQPKDNIRDFWETGVVTNNTLALSGGSDKSSARLSFNNTTIKGITPNHTGDQQTINLRVATKVGARLSFDTKFNYIHKNLDNAPNIGTSQENIVWALVEMGRYTPLSFLREYYEKVGLPTRFPGVRYNPYYIVNELRNNAVRERVVSFASGKYQFNDWLSLMARSGIDFYSEQRKQTWPVGANFSANNAGRIIDETYLTRESNSDILLTASKNNIDNFSLSISAGAYLLRRSTRLQGWDANAFKIKGIYDISNTRNVTPYYSLVKKEMQSVYFSGQVGYKNYLFLDITGRNDWSSTLGTGDYSFFYPSAGSSFVFTDAFNVGSAILTFGKVRASYAEAGNDAPPYLTQSGYFFNPTPINGQSYATQSNSIPLFNLKNELKQSIEFGTDLRFFNDRIGLDATYYKSNTKNQIVPISISTASGYTTKIINAGNIENRGIEIALRINPVELENSLRWEMTFNYAKNNSKVIELAPGIETFPLYYGEPNTIEARIGEPYGNIIGYKYKRSPDGRRIVAENGAYEREAKTSVLGNTTPKWIGGLNNTLSFKGIALNFLIDFVQGNEITSYTKYKMVAQGNAAFTVEGREFSRPLDGVVEIKDENGNVTGYEPNTKTVDGQTYWAQRAWDGRGEEFVLDGSYIMLREVILGYKVSPSLISKTPFTGIRISLVGRNLWYIEEHMQGLGISPETNLNTQAAAAGVETLSMPTTRSYGLNLNLTF